jgi:hypothetical protein
MILNVKKLLFDNIVILRTRNGFIYMQNVHPRPGDISTNVSELRPLYSETNKKARG